MNLLTKHPPCTGLTLWKSKKKVVMLWFQPPRTEVKNHYHRWQNNKIVILMNLDGMAFLKRESQTEAAIAFRYRLKKRTHKVPAFTWHSAQTQKSWFIFLSITTPVGSNQLQKPNEDIVYQGDIQSTYDNIKGPTR